ncbi:MAG: metallophosphoesterase [Gemmatales bacterium]|nr:metallophosphoesterase [Gemmatales bacterium]MDW7995526.1 metallophosphoesterase [Gemmatales bacterium]
MLLAVTADLHYPKASNFTLSQLAQAIERQRPDVLLIAGDLGDCSAYSATSLAFFRQLPCPKLVLAGNHDLYPHNENFLRSPSEPVPVPQPHSTKELTSAQLWQGELRRQIQAQGGVWLEDTVYVRPPVAIVGTIAWYDYSAADPQLGYGPEVYAREKRFFSTDDRINWPWSDLEFADMVSREFLKRLDQVVEDPRVAHIVVVTHVPILEEQLLRRPGDRYWGFSNAYFGNLTLGRQVLQRPKVCLVVSGHTHIGRHVSFLAPNGRLLHAAVVGRRQRQPRFLLFRIPPLALPHLAVQCLGEDDSCGGISRP